MWVVTDPAVINAVRAGMRDKPIFIADGHHRYETSLNYRRELKAAGQLTDDNAPPNFVLMMFVGMQDPGLQVLPTHRLVTGCRRHHHAAIAGGAEIAFRDRSPRHRRQSGARSLGTRRNGRRPERVRFRHRRRSNVVLRPRRTMPAR